MKKVVLEPLPSALAEGLFYIMLLWFRRTIMPHYVKKLGKKNYWRKLRSVRVFSKNCASNFFWSVGKGVGIGM